MCKFICTRCFCTLGINSPVAQNGDPVLLQGWSNLFLFRGVCSHPGVIVCLALLNHTHPPMPLITTWSYTNCVWSGPLANLWRTWCVYVCLFVCVSVCVCECVCVCLWVWVCDPECVCGVPCSCISMFVHYTVKVCVFVCVFVSIWVCVHVDSGLEGTCVLWGGLAVSLCSSPEN